MPVYYLLHVPKTAGVTIAEHLEQHCAPGIFWRPQLTTQAPAAPEKIRAVALGHYQGRAVERHFAGQEPRRIVMLREPESLQISYYNWRMLHFRERGVGTYDFDLHLDTVPRNFMLHFLLHRWMGLSHIRLLAMSDADKLALAQRALSEFWFVGDSADCDRVIATLAPELDVPPVAARRNGLTQLQDFVSWNLLTKNDLTARQRARLRHEQGLDQLLWETWHGAAFEAAKVAPAAAPHASGGGWRHDLSRPLREIVRLRRRGRKPDSAEGNLLRAQLLGAPQDVKAWRDYLTYCRARPGNPLPPEVAGTTDVIRDAVLCTLKGELLLHCGQQPQALAFLRRAPRLAATRRQAIDLVYRACAHDAPFKALVVQADRTRDQRQWRQAADLYAQLLALYPGHCGYRLQYAHCLLAQGDDGTAEMQYRSARAQGAPWSDTAPFLAAIAARRGEAPPSAPPGPHPRAKSLLDDPPTEADVRLVWATTDVRQGNEDEILNLLRKISTIGSVLAALVPPERVEEARQRFLEKSLALA